MLLCGKKTNVSGTVERHRDRENKESEKREGEVERAENPWRSVIHKESNTEEGRGGVCALPAMSLRRYPSEGFASSIGQRSQPSGCVAPKYTTSFRMAERNVQVS